MTTTIVPCLWFDTQAEEAARYYVGIFKNSKITAITYYPDEGNEIHGKKAGTVLTVAFELNGQPFTALNGGPQFQFSPAVSLQVMCEDQAEIDYYWEKLGVDGDPTAQRCGWVEDKFGFSWQVVPKLVPALLLDHNSAACRRVFAAIMEMDKIDIAELQRAYAG
ncbi:3-demethylubiquinone-9 3-methyltransferase [Chthoniobacter flavus Ellin428]|uniref:3-demethylubiquinone-9 3-methyltransferase n=1 Tax=Chthoniobacter flavus Ellin428 TaxID=497964 RepID=B4D492_9BACT|nr:VOC family protein [Chthoniobacter flavus]EDY18693.1 3-demethylubiquinone-9 3-methyltransferase [Chthoniobacter flavus Ellin428]TCO89068.1 putative 3-demethylubiquinone-9 3-methyltransferase (glyoxalase superfamily) [Chthoniobacter flavus]